MPSRSHERETSGESSRTAVDDLVVVTSPAPSLRRNTTLMGHGMEEDIDAETIPIW